MRVHEGQEKKRAPSRLTEGPERFMEVLEVKEGFIRVMVFT